MTWLLGLFTGGLPFGGAIIAGLLVVGGGFYAYERSEIHGLNSEIAGLNCRIDGPTEMPPCKTNGYIAQIGALNANLAQAHANENALQAALASANGQVDQWKAAADKASQQAALAQRQAKIATDKANTVTAQLLAMKPVTQDFGSLVDEIRAAVQ